MRCIFCKQDSSASRSVEHIVPESLGNKRAVLPRGVVCDKCNNYFASKVEEPLLSSSAFKSLRFHQAIPSKRNRIPPATVTLEDQIPGVLYRPVNPDYMPLLSLDADPDTIFRTFDNAVQERGGAMLLFPSNNPMPRENLMSRFLAKCAIEALAQRFTVVPEGQDYLTDEPQFDRLRNHARRGDPSEWPFHQRVIYDANREVLDENGQSVQTIYEYDVFPLTPDCDTNGAMRSEVYFILAIFGVEFAINIGGPSIDSYIAWLDAVGGTSPLYLGRNSQTR